MTTPRRRHFWTVVASTVAAATCTLAGAPAAHAAAGFDLQRLAGTDRFTTADAIADATFADGATDALLAVGADFADALAGNYLAGDLASPVLLSGRDDVPASTIATLQGLGVETVTLLGGVGALSEAVHAELDAAGFAVERVSGRDRYATARAIAEKVDAATIGVVEDQRTALLATGQDFPDAVAGGSLAYAGRFPILLTTGDALHSEASAAFETLGIERVYVLGGTATVSDSVAGQVAGMGIDVERLAGTSRAETAVAVAQFAVETLGFADSDVNIATGADFADAIAGGPHAGERNSVILLSAGAESRTCTFLTALQATLTSGRIFGGTGAVSVADETALEECGLSDDAGLVDGLEVTGEHELREIGTSRACTVVAPADTTVHLRLLRSVDVTTAEDGTLDFADDDRDGLADTVPVAPSITSVDGVSQPADTTAVGDVTGGGEIDVTLGADGEGDVILVAFADGEVGTARSLDVDPDGAPVDEVAVGCATAFVPPEALQGVRADVIVHTVGTDLTYFTGAPQGSTHATYMIDDTDEATGKAVSVDSLRALLSAGDVLDVDYDPTPAGPSGFDVNVDTVKGTSKPTATAVDHSADGTTDDVRLAFVPPEHNGDGTVYRITRVATHADSAGTCTSSIAETGTTVGTADASPFVDLGVPEGCWIYRTVAASPTGATAVSAFSDPVATPGEPPDSLRPRSLYASVTDDGDGVLGVDDVIHLVFDETMAAPADGATITVAEGGSSVAFTAGTDATFSLVQVKTTVGPTERPARTVIEVRPTSAPTADLAHPATVTAHTGVTDLAANGWDIAQSPDRVLDVES